MISLSTEGPLSLLDTLTPLFDLDFALAHLVLSDPSYALYYKNRASKRELILDNSMYELGYPLPLADLQVAAAKVEPDYVIAPDYQHDAKRTFDAWKETFKVFGRKASAVIWGDNQTERQHFANAVTGRSDMICLPFRGERLSWYTDDLMGYVQQFPRVHLLGVNEFSELIEWARIAREMPYWRWSVDTSKPIKWGLNGTRFRQNISYRKCPLRHDRYLEWKEPLSSAEEADIFYNIAFLRKYL